MKIEAISDNRTIIYKSKIKGVKYITIINELSTLIRYAEFHVEKK